MALQNTFYFDVDLKHATYPKEPRVTQNDEVTFILRMYDDGEDFALTDISTYTLASLRKDGQSVLTVGTKTGDNEITFALGTSEVSVPGKVKAAIQLYATNGRVSSIPFTYEVLDDLATGYVPSKKEETLIELVLGQGPAILKAAEDATADAIQATSDLTVLKTEVTDATNSANTAANHATTEGNRASTQADRADTAATNAEGVYNAILPVLPNIEGWGYDPIPYDPATTYEKNNIVSLDGSTYISLVDNNVGNTPTLATPNANWSVLARKGIDGTGAVSSVNGVGPDASGDVTIPDPDLSGLATKAELQTLDDEFTTRLTDIDKKMMVSVTDFGAVGDGVADDTQAIKAAISYASTIDNGRTGTTHPTVYFPPGKYKITSTITISVNFITLKGEGQKQSIIEGKNLTSDMVVINSDYGVKLEELFLLNSNTTSSRTVYLSKGERHIVESCFFENKAGNSAVILYYQGANTKIRNCSFNNFESEAYCIRVYANTTQININSDIVGNYFGGNGKGIIIGTSEVTRRPEGIKIHENTFLLTGSEQLTIKSAYYVDISHNIIDVAKTYNIWITPELAGVDGININDNYFGNTAEYGQTIRVEDTSVKALNVTVSDNYFGISGYAIRGYKNLEGAIIAGNYFKDIRQTSISLTESKKVIISGNIEVSTAFSLNLSDGVAGGPFIISNNFFTGSMMLTKTTASKFKILNNIGLE